MIRDSIGVHGGQPMRKGRGCAIEGLTAPIPVVIGRSVGIKIRNAKIERGILVPRLVPQGDAGNDIAAAGNTRNVGADIRDVCQIAGQ